MSDQKLTPEPLMKIATAFQASKVLALATYFDVFSSISGGVNTCHRLSSETGIDVRSLRSILNACSAIDILKKDGDIYSNSDLAETFLVRGKSSYFGDMIVMQGTRLYDAWGELESVMRLGHPSADIFGTIRNDPVTAKIFTAAMHNNALGPARQLAAKVDLQFSRVLMDIGGGSGAYSLSLAKAFPNISAYVVDLPNVCLIADEYIAASSLGERVRTYPADIFVDVLPDSCDVALLSQVLHSYSSLECEGLISRIYDILPQGGTIIVHEFFMDDDGSGPPFPALFAVNMLLESERGTSYSRKEVASWLRSVGFLDVRREDFAGPSGILIATKGA
ncbi:methyltransferase [Magnetospirillum fulvum]|uniref:Dimerisation domain-containing protein n=1 Tax=Magnetospirillum fulvum TaxID=1082 RepID=A0A1H6HB49_MAGFU|nr:methyltransferase [Magnetospirillum fulvum]SEH31193.1 Dimerisation domain-containing protein [Magnetospirillum fulvum]